MWVVTNESKLSLLSLLKCVNVCSISVQVLFDSLNKWIFSSHRMRERCMFCVTLALCGLCPALPLHGLTRALMYVLVLSQICAASPKIHLTGSQ